MNQLMGGGAPAPTHCSAHSGEQHGGTGAGAGQRHVEGEGTGQRQGEGAGHRQVARRNIEKGEQNIALALASD